MRTEISPEVNTSTPDDNAIEARYDLRVLRSLRRIIRSVELYSKKLASECKVTGPQLICLLTIREHKTITASKIAKEIHLSPSTVVGVLDRLEEKGLVERRRDKMDRRRVYISLTPEGQALAESAPSPLQDRLASAMSKLEEQEQSTIASALERIVDLMEVSQVDASPFLEPGSKLD